LIEINAAPRPGAMLPRMAKYFATVAFCALLAGCADMVVVNDPVTQPNYLLGEENYAARNGAIRVEVAGETFGLPPDRFADLVVGQMRAGYYRHGFFTREASRATDPRYRIVMMFNPDPGLSANALCAAPVPPAPAPRNPAARSSLLAAFCAGGEARSEIQGWVRLSGVEDANFARLVDAVTARIFPRRDIRQERL
jgi:hypothetical protein